MQEARGSPFGPPYVTTFASFHPHCPSPPPLQSTTVAGFPLKIEWLDGRNGSRGMCLTYVPHEAPFIVREAVRHPEGVTKLQPVLTLASRRRTHPPLSFPCKYRRRRHSRGSALASARS